MDSVATVSEAPPKKLKRINYALAATLVASGMSLAEVAMKVGAKNANTLRVGLGQRGVTQTAARRLPLPEERIAPATLRIAAQAAGVLRDSLGSGLATAVEQIGRTKVTYNKLASKGQGHAKVLKTLAETHRILYGGAETQVNIFGVEHMETKTIDVQSERVESTETQEG